MKESLKILFDINETRVFFYIGYFRINLIKKYHIVT